MAETRPPGILRSDVMMFPHHGGGCGDDRRSPDFARLLSAMTGAPHIVVQNGSSRLPEQPHRNILAGIRSVPFQPNVTCTDLSSLCGSRPDDNQQPRCAGNITFRGRTDLDLSTERKDHNAFRKGLRDQGVLSAQCTYPPPVAP